MKALLTKKALYAGSYVVMALIMEFITFNFFGAGLFPQYWWLDVSVLLLLGAIIFVIPSFIAQALFIFVLLVVQTVIGFVNESLYTVSGNIFSIDMLSLGGEVADAFNSSFVSYPYLFLMIFCVLAETVLLICLFRLKAKHNFKASTVIAMLVVFCVAQISSSGIYAAAVDSFVRVDESEQTYVLEDDRYLYDTQFLKEKAFRKFGTFAFYYKNILNIVGANAKRTEEDISSMHKDVQQYFDNCDVSEKTPYFGALKGNNLIVVMIESGETFGINPEYTPTLHALLNQGVYADNYYARDKTNHSEAIAMLGNYPLESVLVKNGIYKYDLMENDWSFALPSVMKNAGYNTTYMHNNTNTFYARNTTHPVFGFQNTYFIEDMPEVRQTPKQRFNDFDSDRLMFTKMDDEIAPSGENPFFTFVTTVITHGDYDDLNKYGDYSKNWTDAQKAEFSAKCAVKKLEPYYEIITDYAPSQKAEIVENLKVNGVVEGSALYETVYRRYKRYQAGLMDLDRGLAHLLEKLHNEGRLDNTTILLYGDHASYFNDQNYYLKGVPIYEEDGDRITYNPNAYHVPLMIYDGSMPFDNTNDGLFYDGFTHAGLVTPKIPVGRVSRYACTFDIVPTLLDLFGYQFNTGLYQGASIFSSNNVPTTAFISRENGMFNDIYYTKDGQEALYIDRKKGGSEDGYQAFRLQITEYYRRQRALEKLYKSDFFHADSTVYSFADFENVMWTE